MCVCQEASEQVVFMWSADETAGDALHLALTDIDQVVLRRHHTQRAALAPAQQGGRTTGTDQEITCRHGHAVAVVEQLLVALSYCSGSSLTC